MFEQELTPRGFSHYAGLFLQYEYSDREIALATQQISGGINITHLFHRRGDSFGWEIGLVKPSDEKLSQKYFSETYYRLQFTENLQWSFDLQIYIKPSLSEHDIASVFTTRLLFEQDGLRINFSHCSLMPLLASSSTSTLSVASKSYLLTGLAS
jgi:carbohydrate-selective porin OprB